MTQINTHKEAGLEAAASVEAGKPAVAVKSFTSTDFLLLGCIVIWALNSPIVKIVLREMQPLAVSQFRVTIAALISLVILLFREKSARLAWRHVPLLTVAALCGITINQITFIYALSNTSASAVSLLYATSPLFATVLAFVIFREKLKKSYFLGLPLALAGVVLIILTAPNASLDGNVLGNLTAVGMALSWAAYTVLLRPLLNIYSPLRLSTYCFAIGSVCLLPFSFSQVAQTATTPVSLNAWLLLLSSAVFAMVVTNIIWYGGVKRLGVSRTAYYSYLQPFFGVLAAALMLGELIVPWQILGGILVIGSLLIYRLVK